MPFAIVDRERVGADAVLMVVEEEAEAEALVIWWRLKHVRADFRTIEPKPRRPDRHVA
jgi:hypothetical protein